MSVKERVGYIRQRIQEDKKKKAHEKDLLDKQIVPILQIMAELWDESEAQGISLKPYLLQSLYEEEHITEAYRKVYEYDGHTNKFPPKLKSEVLDHRIYNKD